MGGNINSKKSWHPSRGKAQEILWKKEKQALEEQKRIREKCAERAEERRMAALQQLQDNVSGTVAAQRVDWMYSQPKPEYKITQEREAYLLGRPVSKTPKTAGH